MNKDIFISGSIVVTRDENKRVKFIQFVPDDEFTPVLEQSSKTSGQLQLLRNAAFDYVANKPRVRSNSLLIRKARHVLRPAVRLCRVPGQYPGYAGSPGLFRGHVPYPHGGRQRCHAD